MIDIGKVRMIQKLKTSPLNCRLKRSPNLKSLITEKSRSTKPGRRPRSGAIAKGARSGRRDYRVSGGKASTENAAVGPLMSWSAPACPPRPKAWSKQRCAVGLAPPVAWNNVVGVESKLDGGELVGVKKRDGLVLGPVNVAGIARDVPVVVEFARAADVVKAVVEEQRRAALRGKNAVHAPALQHLREPVF